jgi:hypothetical protein
MVGYILMKLVINNGKEGISMIQRTRAIGDRTFTVKCEEHFLASADWLLKLFEEIEDSRGIHDGMRIQAGWSILTAVESNGAVEVLAPDYNGDPFTDTTDNLSVYFSVQLAQNEVLKQLSLEGEASLFQDKIIAAKGVFDREMVYLERSQDVSEGDSGWYIGPVEQLEEQPELEAFYMYELLKLRPSLLKALAIPKGYLVVFNGVDIEAVLDENNHKIWSHESKR